MNKCFAFFLLLTAGFFNVLQAQTQHSYQEDIGTIRNYDKIYAPPENPILFIGSSSIRKWDDLERVFSHYVVLNRGFGGAELNDVTYFAEDIIFPYHPRQIIIYAGENDLPDEVTTADSVLARFKNLYACIRAKLPVVPIVYISIKPSPVRERFFEKAQAANKLIAGFLAGEQNTRFLDLYSLMLDKSKRPRKELFVGDMLHMNRKGYAIWEAAVKPYLLEPR
ncbi:GDSL-type esterase/lipase family protein [Chitinophaga nivalis]|uniref:GDSL-type esterase/lipase family protein n=1 Tax=Chitinophaga nivalis TaxID=2991709 RepID=A0ABT3IP51_9BACT|nr:GDSL-type esterase/lipase family protein [Chitinophaga nivalis]MCW3464557.1 GDSL-type esterase/lipase family protein [Chitinophaga nivalis]MCW3485752.1 GDSL-type esterase/lipase family protein [Chitinophaga nivalis]